MSDSQEKKQSRSEKSHMVCIVAKAGALEGGAELLKFAGENGISPVFDPSLPKNLLAMTFIREARLPQGLEKGTQVLLNPVASEEDLAQALIEKLRMCKVARQP